MNFLIDGLDRLGKDTLISGVLNSLGYHTILHKSRPIKSKKYDAEVSKLGKTHEYWYQHDSFCQDMALLKQSEISNFSLIFNRTWIGEAVYSPLYRGYNGDYVFNLEKIAGIDSLKSTRMILLTEDFSKSKHFVDDGESFDISKREAEQQMFVDAFNKSIIQDKRIVCVTADDGQFKPKERILKEVLI